jgi:hypothetical protein
MRELSDRHAPAAERITVGLDNLNPHSPASFYQAFAPLATRRWAERCAFQDTPPHACWLNRAEIEGSVGSRPCLDRRIGDAETLRHERQAWRQQRHSARKSVGWQFTTAEARSKLKRLYPGIQT